MQITHSNVFLTGEIIRETAKAIQFKFTDEDDIERLEWFPFSQVSEIHRIEPAKIVVSSWIYGQKQKEWN